MDKIRNRGLNTINPQALATMSKSLFIQKELFYELHKVADYILYIFVREAGVKG
jgi:hypothetical protein